MIFGLIILSFSVIFTAALAGFYYWRYVNAQHYAHRLNSIVDDLPIGIIGVNSDQTIQFANRYLQKRFTSRVISKIPDIVNDQPRDMTQTVTIEQHHFWISIGSNNKSTVLHDAEIWYLIPAKVLESYTIQDRNPDVIELPELDSLKIMARGLAHEFKNPITSIKMLLEMIEQDNRSVKDIAQQFKRILAFEVERLDRILGDFLNFADVGTLSYKDENIMDVIAEVERLIHQNYPDATFTLSKEMSPVPKVSIDRQKIIQVLLNVIINGIEALPECGGHISIELRKRQADVIIQISNDGKAIIPEELSKLFLPFYSTKQDGTGLGLPISQRIVVEHGGKITCQSNPEDHTVFYIRLPINRIIPDLTINQSNHTLSRNPIGFSEATVIEGGAQ